MIDICDHAIEIGTVPPENRISVWFAPLWIDPVGAVRGIGCEI